MYHYNEYLPNPVFFTHLFFPSYDTQQLAAKASKERKNVLPSNRKNVH